MKVVTLEKLINHFREIGLKEGMVIEVHSSLSSFGHVEGGAKTVIEALMSIVTPTGTIVIATFPLSREIPLGLRDRELGIFFKKRWLPEDSMEKSDMGIISDTFRSYSCVFSG